jgi:hypothetical protein
MTSESPPESRDSRPDTPKSPWPMSWILIIILAYIALQTAYFLFYGD